MNKFFKIILLLSIFSVNVASAKEMQEIKVVYDLRSDDIDTIHKLLINTVKMLSTYYKKNNKKLVVTVVISSKSYKYFIDDIKSSPYAWDTSLIAAQERLKPRLEMLYDLYNVTFKMCLLGMTIQEIEKSTLYPYIETTATRSIYLIDAQNDGYAYMPLH